MRGIGSVVWVIIPVNLAVVSAGENLHNRVAYQWTEKRRKNINARLLITTVKKESSFAFIWQYDRVSWRVSCNLKQQSSPSRYRDSLSDKISKLVPCMHLKDALTVIVELIHSPLSLKYTPCHQLIPMNYLECN